VFLKGETAWNTPAVVESLDRLYAPDEISLDRSIQELAAPGGVSVILKLQAWVFSRIFYFSALADSHFGSIFVVHYMEAVSLCALVTSPVLCARAGTSRLFVCV